MIVVDASAVVAIILREPEERLFRSLIFRSASAVISAASVVEAGIVLQRRFGEAGIDVLEEFLAASGLRVETLSAGHAAIALQAYARFGKGTGHRAQLNFGDCLAYALAKATNSPLLFKGQDFAYTDLPIAAE